MSIRKFFVKYPAVIATLFFVLLGCFLCFTRIEYLRLNMHIAIAILLGMCFITFLTIALFKNKYVHEEKLKVYTYCSYCGEKVETGNKYHHACLMKKYKGELIKNE